MHHPSMEMLPKIEVGSRVYLRNAIAGEPGVVTKLAPRGRCWVIWPDMPEIGRETFHSADSLVVDEGFTVKQLGLAFEAA